MIPQTQLILQSYFVTGAVPTQAQYLELIGTMFYLNNALNTAVNAAVASINAAVTAIEALAPKGICAFNSTAITLIGGAGAQTNVNTVTAIGGGIFRVTWTVPFGNATYKPLVNGGTINALNANYTDVSVPVNGNVYLFAWQ